MNAGVVHSVISIVINNDYLKTAAIETFYMINTKGMENSIKKWTVISLLKKGFQYVVMVSSSLTQPFTHFCTCKIREKTGRIKARKLTG